LALLDIVNNIANVEGMSEVMARSLVTQEVMNVEIEARLEKMGALLDGMRLLEKEQRGRE
jgi:hypothetical protein